MVWFQNIAIPLIDFIIICQPAFLTGKCKSSVPSLSVSCLYSLVLMLFRKIVGVSEWQRDSLPGQVYQVWSAYLYKF